MTVEIVQADGSAVSLHRQDHLRRPVVQRADRHLPDPRHGRQPEGRAAPEPVRARAAAAARCGRTRSWCRSARCSRARKGHFAWVVEQGWQGRAAAGGGRRLVRRQLVHQRRPAAPATSWWSTARSACRAGATVIVVQADGKATARSRSRQRRPARPEARGRAHVLALLHRTADLRGGGRDHPVPGRAGVDDGAAGAAVPGDHAGAGDGAGHLPRRRLKTLADSGGLADRGADQRRGQHALHEQHQLGHRPAGADRVLLAGHRPRHRPGAGAEPRQPGAAAAARGGARSRACRCRRRARRS